MAPAKDELRRTLRRKREEIPTDVAESAAHAAARHALGLEALCRAQIVALTASVRHELSMAPLFEALAERDVALALPRVGPGRTLNFYRVQSLVGLAPGTFDVPEPALDAPAMPLEQIDVFVIPGLAFDDRGTRLGWGKGHYDATLAAHPDATRIGFAFQFQLVDEVPATELDVSMDFIVTESGIRTCTEGRHSPPSSL